MNNSIRNITELPENVQNTLGIIKEINQILEIPILFWEFPEATSSLKDKHRLLENSDIERRLMEITPSMYAGWYKMRIWLATNLTLAGKTKEGKAFLATIICAVGDNSGLSNNEIDRILNHYGVDIRTRKPGSPKGQDLTIPSTSIEQRRAGLHLGTADLDFNSIGIDPGAFSPLLPQTDTDIDNLLIERFLSDDFGMEGVVTYVEIAISTTISIFVPYRFLYKLVKAFAAKVRNKDKLIYLSPMQQLGEDGDEGRAIFTYKASHHLRAKVLQEA